MESNQKIDLGPSGAYVRFTTDSGATYRVTNVGPASMSSTSVGTLKIETDSTGLRPDPSRQGSYQGARFIQVGRAWVSEMGPTTRVKSIDEHRPGKA